MARRLLSPWLAYASALTALALSGCRHDDQHAAPQVSTSASASAFTQGAREAHFRTELTRARARWKSKPALGNCSLALHEKEDLELCEAASSALTVLEQEPEASGERALPALENSALALARLSKRLRYLSLAELSKKRLAGDGGAPAAEASARGAFRWPPNRKKEAGERGSFEISDGPVLQMLATSVHLERDVMRNLGAYLEYSELSTRATAFDTVKRLNQQHPQWPLLTQLLREAALLESEPGLKGKLEALSASTQASGVHSAQSAGSK